MPKFSKISIDRVCQAHPDLQTLFFEVIKYFDCTVLCSVRTKAEQDKAFAEGKSKLKYPNSKHNTEPSHAVDVVPYPIDWNDNFRFCIFAGYVLGIANMLKIQGRIKHDIRWGGDWNMNTQIQDEKFRDFPHFELI